ncbi:hypothetical protein AALB16_10745 [Lachnospiraceae bacterium 62-35]
MIFKTFDSSDSGMLNKIGIFNHSFGEVRDAFQSGGFTGVKDLYFNSITNDDIARIQEYNSLVTAYENGLPDGVNYQAAWYRTMFDASEAAKRLVESNGQAAVSEELLGKAMQASSFSAKAGEAALQALAKAGNMLLFMAVSKGIELTIKYLDNYVNRLKYAKEALQSSQSAYEQITSKLGALNQQLESCDTKIKELESRPGLSFIEQEELENLRNASAELQNQIELHKILENAAKGRTREAALKYLNQQTSYMQYGSWDMSQVDRGEAHYGQVTGNEIFSGNVIETARQQIAEYEDLLQRKQDVEKRIQDFQLANPDEAKYTPAQRDALTNLKMELQSYDDSLHTLSTSLYETVPELDVFKSSLSPDYDQELIHSIDEIIKLYLDSFGSKEENVTNKFNEVWKSSDFSSARKELEKLAAAGKLTPEVLESTERYRQLVEAAGVSADKVAQHIRSLVQEGQALPRIFSPSEMIAAISKMSTGFEALDQIYESISEKGPFDFKLLDQDGFKEAFSTLDKYEDFIDTISHSSDDVSSCQESFDRLLTSWISSTGILDKVSDETAELTASMLSGMGVANAEELVTSALADNHARLAAEKYYNAGVSEQLKEASAEETFHILKEAEAAGISSLELARLELAKSSINGIQLNTSSDIDQIIGLANAANSSASALYRLEAAKAVINGSALVDPTSSQYDREAAYEAQLVLHQLETGTFDFDFEPLDPDKYKKAVYGTENKPVSSGGLGSRGSEALARAADQEIDWFERRKNLLKKKQEDLESQSSSSFLSYLGLTGDEFTQAQEILSRTTQPVGEDLQKLTDIASSAGISLSQLMDILAAGGHDSRRGAFDALLKLDERDIEAGKQSIEKYKQQFEEAAETLSPDILNKILDGGLNIESYPEQEAEKIQNVISLFDKWKNAEVDLRESEKKRKEDILAGYDNRAEAFDKEIQLSENHNDYINAEIKYLEESGQLVNASSYETILANLQHQEALLEKKLALRRKQLQALLDSGEIEEGSKEYYQLQGYIDDCEESLIGLETQQEEYNNKLLQLPIENMDTILDMYRSIQEEIEGWGNVLEASGQKLDSQYYQTLIDNGMELISQYQEQAELVRDVMNEYETGSDQWNKLYSRLTDIGSSISSMTQNLHEWNEELLRMPLASMSTFTDELNKVLDSLNRIQDDYDTVISAVTSSIRDYRESLQKANEADNEAYQSRIDGLQEQLDLLNKQNEQLRLQTSYEQALYDLQTANTQKTERVIRNGEIVYETNADNLRNAKESVQNALADLEEYKMRSEIDNLGDILDGINEKYNDQIEALDKISEKWEKIASDTEKAADYAVASEYLGNNWQEKITSGNDLDLYAAFKASYESNADNIHTYKEQITATENIYTLLEEYINSYREGTLTYEQAMKGIQGLLSQMNQVMSSGQNLQNVLDYLSLTNGTDSDTAAVLEGIQKSLSESSDELLENMKQYNENLDLIAGCMTSWETLVDNTNQMVDLLEEVRDNLEDALDEIGRQIREKEEDDDDDRDSGRYTTNGGTAPRHDKNDWGSDTEGPGVKHSNKGSSESAGVETYGDGIKKGLVGRSGPSAREDMLKTLAGRELDPKEFPALLHYHEAVFNEEQQALLIKNLTGAYAAVPDMPFPDCTGKLFYNVPKYTPSPTNHYQVSISDVNVQGVKNVEDFINSMATLSSQALRQQFSKGF